MFQQGLGKRSQGRCQGPKPVPPHRDSLQLELHHTVSLKKVPSRKGKPAAVLSAAREPASLPLLWLSSRALQPPELSLSVLVLLVEEVSCGRQGK